MAEDYDIKKFREWTEGEFEVIVSYDCSDEHDPFGDRLRELLKDQWPSEPITKSNYMLKKPITIGDQDRLKADIKRLFSEAQKMNEDTSHKETIVKLIIAKKQKFEIVTVVNAPVL